MKAPLCFPVLKPMYRLDINMLLSSESLPIYGLCVYIDLKLIFQIKSNRVYPVILLSLKQTKKG